MAKKQSVTEPLSESEQRKLDYFIAYRDHVLMSLMIAVSDDTNNDDDIIDAVRHALEDMWFGGRKRLLDELHGRESDNKKDKKRRHGRSSDDSETGL